MKNKNIAVLVTSFAIPLLTGCIPAPDVEAAATHSAEGVACNSKAVESYIGKRFTAILAEKMRKEAGATLLRTGAKDGPVTMDYRSERLNVFYDEAMLIAVVNCG